MLKKILIILTLLLIIILINSGVYATEIKTRLDIIQKSSEIKYLENDQGYISKTIVDSNKDTGEVTIELKLSNTAKEVEKVTYTEIFLVVDNSPSMDFVTSTGKTRKELVLNSATQLVKSIFNNSNNVKIGLIDFHGRGESASINNAIVRQKLTDNEETVLSAIQTQLQRKTEGGTNIDAGLQKAQQNFSKTSGNKIIILLTDGIPNADVKGTNPADSNDVTDAGCVEVGVNTKETLLRLKKLNIYTITLLTGMSESDGNTDKYGTEYEERNTLEEKLKAAEDIFGTTTNPTADKYYLVSNVNINKSITEDIFKDVTDKIQNPINTTKIVDYFPEDITDNFEFSYVGDASIGTTSHTIDTESKTITWDIGILKGDEVATLKYKLKINDMKNTDLLNKTIATNEKVVLTYKDTEAKDYTAELISSPKIQLLEEKEDLTAIVTYNPTEKTAGNVAVFIQTNKKVSKVDGWTLSEDGKILTKMYDMNTIETVHLKDFDGMTKDVEINVTNINKVITTQEKDTTIATGKIPQTGLSLGVVFSIIAVVGIGIIFYTKYKKLENI